MASVMSFAFLLQYQQEMTVRHFASTSMCDEVTTDAYRLSSSLQKVNWIKW